MENKLRVLALALPLLAELLTPNAMPVRAGQRKAAIPERLDPLAAERARPWWRRIAGG